MKPRVSACKPPCAFFSLRFECVPAFVSKSERDAFAGKVINEMCNGFQSVFHGSFLMRFIEMVLSEKSNFLSLISGFL